MPKLPKSPRNIHNRLKMRDHDEYELLKRGFQLQENGMLAEAKIILEQILVVNPQNFDALHLLGINMAQTKNYSFALKLFDKSLKLNPNNFYALMNRANVLLEMRDFKNALQNYSKVILLQPNYAEAYYNRGNAFLYQSRFKDAIASYDAAISLEARHAMAFANRGTALKNLKYLKLAFDSYKSAQNISPDLYFLSGMIIFLKMQMCDWDDLDDEIAQLVESVSSGKKSSSCLELLALIDDPSTQLKAAKIYGLEQRNRGSDLGPSLRQFKAGKIRIGYFSADFKDHPVAYLSAQLFETHDREKFEVIAFSLSPAESGQTRVRLVKAFDRFLDVSEKTDKDVAELSRRLNIDIAIDLGGHTNGNRLGIFSYRAAPIQVNFLGYPGTLGVDYVDYIIADENVIPQDWIKCYTEKVCYLPHSYLPFDSNRTRSLKAYTRAAEGLPEGAFVFSAFNASYKIRRELFASWMRILSNVTGSVLWLADLNEWARENLLKEAARFSVHESRIIFASRVEHVEDHLERQKLTDMALDTFPYNGHTTTIDFLWSGVPVLTRRGCSFASRVAASLLTTLGLPELVTSSNEEYEFKAIQFASHHALFGELKMRLAKQVLSSPLFHSAIFTKNIELAYTRMHERHQNGLQPESFRVSDD